MLRNLFTTDLFFWIPAIVISLTVHEFCHAYAAYKLGDYTARNLGRLTLNPLAHLDPIGFICLVLFHFGWAKPVPVNPYNFRAVDYKTGMLLTALAGPMSNILLCFLFTGIYSFMPMRILYAIPWVNGILQYLFMINASLAFFNLIPVPPLDGSKILAGILPDRMSYAIQVLEQYGSIFLMLLLISSLPSMIISPLSNGLIRGFLGFFRLFS
ncbi:MAG: site-2 protease family protein [Peptococcaceae bacterium]|nr:site-2 protease family protein [Peptococcaceae bacterium]